MTMGEATKKKPGKLAEDHVLAVAREIGVSLMNTSSEHPRENPEEEYPRRSPRWPTQRTTYQEIPALVLELWTPRTSSARMHGGDQGALQGLLSPWQTTFQVPPLSGGQKMPGTPDLILGEQCLQGQLRGSHPSEGRERVKSCPGREESTLGPPDEI